MATLVEVPHIGMDLSEVTIVEWLVAEGGTVNKGDPILTIETDKTNHDLEAEASGVIRNQRGAAGDVIAVGAPLGWIVTEGESTPDLPSDEAEGGSAAISSDDNDNAADTTQTTAPPAETTASDELPAPVSTGPMESADQEAADQTGTSVTQTDSATRGLASPAARRDAATHGLDIAQLGGSGPGGTVFQADVASAVSAESAPVTSYAPAGTSPTETVALSRIQQITGERTQASFRDVPHFYLERDLQVGSLQELRNDLRERLDIKPSLGALLCFAIARTLGEHSRINGRLVNEKTVELQSAVHLGIAVATERGLLVPVIRDASQLRLTTFLERYRDLTQRAAAGKLVNDELAGGTFSVSNLGMFGVDRFSAIINPPQAGILALGRLRTMPQWSEGQWQPVSSITATLSVDHRVADGADGGRFLADLARHLAHWTLLL